MPNALTTTTSPYLLQHADNPVDWQPWGQTAFDQAKAESKPVFLSIGYSTCHWCHVMAHESFENPDVAAVLNEYFVNVKVDREERPDVDRLYMSFVQATTGSGGWPMSVWLTPDGKPFFGGTYFPPTDRYGRPGFVTVLERITELWATDRPGIIAQGDQVIEALRAASAPTSTSSHQPAESTLAHAIQAFAQTHDRTNGGFGGGPKFPRPSVLNFLLGTFAAQRPGGDEARDIALHTLREMAAGGIHDHVGGGFHRYSVDGQWHVPHFEKMLYDQAQLVSSYLDAYQITGDKIYSAPARDSLDYVARDLSHPDGGFFSAEDADSLIEPDKPAHAEGAFYVWTETEIDALLGDQSPAFKAHTHVQPDGNTPPEADPHHEFTGKNILTLRPTNPDHDQYSGPIASKFGTSDDFARCREILFNARENRPRPHLDDKILAAWNGLMISAFARAGAILGSRSDLDRAIRATEFLRTHLFDGTHLYRSWRDGTRGEVRAFAEDYAYLIQGLLDLYEASLDSQWLAWATDLQRQQDTLFADPDGGGYFASEAGDPLVLVRSKEEYDGAEPSASSISARNLLRLAWTLHDDEFEKQARSVIAAVAPIIEAQPTAVPQMLAALDFSLSAPRQIVIAGDRNAADTRSLVTAAHATFQPHQVIFHADNATADLPTVDGKATAYVCEDFSCQAPITDPSQLI
jgi:hypothetical protein